MIFKSKSKFELLDQYVAKREYTQALEAIAEEIKRRPESFNLLLRQAEILGLAGDRDKAIEIYQQLARHYAIEGFYARAIAVTKKILRLDPKRSEVTSELAALISSQQEAERAARERLDRAETPPPAQPRPEEPSQAAPTPTAEVPETPPEQAQREREAGRFFAAFPRPALEELLASTSVLTFASGDVVMREGDPGASMFLIADGRVEVRTSDTAGRPLELARLGPGEFFGEVAMLTGRPRTATVVAAERTTVVEVTRDELDRLVGTYPEMRTVIQGFLEQRATATVEALLTRMRGSRD